jgi:hypothetical protein
MHKQPHRAAATGAGRKGNMKPITVSLAAGADFEQVASALEASGAVISQRLRELGILVGTAPEANLDRLRAVPGVAAIEGEHQVHTQGSPSR